MLAAPVAAPRSGPYTALCSRLLFPLHERLKKHDSVAVRRRLEQSQWWSPERLHEEQGARLRAFLQRIGQTVPYYRELFRELGLDPAGVRGAQDLARLPFLDKALIRQHRERLLADGHGPVTRYNTGGSSGEPLVFYIGLERKSHDVGAKWRATRWWGVDIGDPELVVWGSPVELSTQDRVRQLRDALMRSHLLPAFDMSEANLDHYVRTIASTRPRMLFGYPSSLSLIAAHAARRGVRLDQLGIRVAFVTSERLYDEQRRQIEAGFGCPVANGYGARDAGFIAHQCPQGGMHLSAEDIVVEIVDPQGQVLPPGESGEIVVTHLGTGDFPFVRYRTGDIAALSTARCACGRGLPMLERIDGRSTDFVVARDGTLMHGLALIYVVRDLPGIARFKIVQHTREHTEVLLVREQGFQPQAEEQIRQGFRRRLGEAVEITVRLVDEIPAEKSGKYRYVQSHALAG